MGMLLFLVACLITYGSLYPFEFLDATLDQATIDTFLASWTAPSSRGDILGNIVLFIPFGLLGQLALPPRGSRIARFLMLLMLGFVLAAGVQVAQLYVPARSPALVDVIWNMVGLVIGALPAFPARVQALVAGQRLLNAKLVPVLLVGCWIGSLLVPFVPSIDLQLWKDSLKPLLFERTFEVEAFIRDFPAWLAAACLGALVVGERWLPVKFALVVLATLGLKIVIVKNHLTLTDVAAAGAAVVVFGALIKYLPRRELLVAVLLLAGHVYLGLSPFEARAGAPEFAWIPFQGSLSGSMFTNAAVIAYKAFFYGALIWLLLRGGLGLAVGAIVAILAAGAVEFGQLYMGHGTPEITDAILALLAAAVIAALTPVEDAVLAAGPRTIDRVSQMQESVPNQIPPEQGAPEQGVPEQSAPEQKTAWIGIALRFALALVLVLAGLTFAMGQARLPYDLTALFARGGAMTEQIILAFALLSIGLGAGIAAQRLSTGRRSYLRLPAWTFLAAIASYLLFYFSLSKASMTAITGPSVFLTRLRVDRVLGDWGADAVTTLGPDRAETLLSIAEPFVRFAALTMPLAVTLAMFGAALWQLDRFPALSGIKRLVFLAFCLVVFAIGALPILLLCKFIAFDVPSDQSIAALVAEQGGFGMGGGLYLYLLLIVLTFSMAWLAWSLRRPRPVRLIVALVLTVLALPAGWWLAQHGITPSVEKLGVSISPLALLLAPENNGLASDQSLMLRWFAGQGAVMALLLLGAFVPSGPKNPAA